ncbi:Aldo-keto reductase yakc [NADP(+)], partial [Colletotrichum tanaceti]
TRPSRSPSRPSTTYIGLSECSAATLRKANPIDKIDAIQAEYPAFETVHETDGLVETARELGVAYVAYSPLGHGWLVDDFPFKSPDDFAPDDFRRGIKEEKREKPGPKFQGESVYKNEAVVDEIEKLAARKGSEWGSLSPGSPTRRPGHDPPIPGTTKAKRLEESWASRDVDLTEEEKGEMRRIIDGATPHGKRYNPTAEAMVGH